MNFELEFLGGATDDESGKCIFPVYNPKTGKRDAICGKKTLVSPSGVPFSMCAEHRKMADEFIRAKLRTKNPGKKMQVGQVVLN